MALLRVRKGVRPGALHPVFSSRQPTVLGREGQVDVALRDPRASRRHAKVTLEGGVWLVEDLGSSNGTILEAAKIEGKARLPDGASLQLGATQLTFHARELAPPPAGEIHGVRPLEALREECGVFVLRGRQAAMDRDVRVDWLHPSREVPARLRRRLEQAFQDAEKVSDGGLVAVLAGRVDAPGPAAQPPADFLTGEGTFVLLREGLGPTLEDKLAEVLALPLDARLELFRALVDLALERASWPSLRSPLGLCHVEVRVAEGVPPRVAIPALDLAAVVAEETGSLIHLPQHLDYLPPECQETRDPAPDGGAASGLAGAMYNVGAMGYHILTRTKAMGELDAASVLANHRNARPAPASLLDPAIPSAVSDLLDAMLEKDPARRPRGRQQVLGAIPFLEVAPRAAAPAAPSSPGGATAKTPSPPKARPGPAGARRPSAAATAAAAATPTAATAATVAAPPVRGAPAARAAEERRPARGETPRGAAAGARGVLETVLYLPLWGIAWVALFFAARYLSRLLFHEMGGT
ncbi:MAG: FHA domain-containing protein [Planctomycetes bacterium]|nr:FHA domain-containing protein [Planctomycetota bacterium]